MQGNRIQGKHLFKIKLDHFKVTSGLLLLWAIFILVKTA